MCPNCNSEMAIITISDLSNLHECFNCGHKEIIEQNCSESVK